VSGSFRNNDRRGGGLDSRSPDRDRPTIQLVTIQLRRQSSSLSNTANVVQRTSGVIATADIGSARAAATAVAEVDANMATATAVLAPSFLRPKKTAGKPAKPLSVNDQQLSAIVLVLPD
jgi:hypothetical protein